MIDRITDVSVEPFNRSVGGGGMLRGFASVEYNEIAMTVPLSNETIKTIEECVERDVDVAIRKMQSCG